MEESEVEIEDYRAFWQKPPFVVLGVVLLVVATILLMVRLDVISWGADRVSDIVGEARYLQKMVDEDILDMTPIGQLHSDNFPNYIAAIIQSNHPAVDERVSAQLETMKLLAADDQLQSILDAWHRDLMEGETEVGEHEHAWNQRLKELGYGYAVVGGRLEDHGEYLYMPESYRVHAEVALRVDDHLVEVQWRQRLDGFRRAGESTFYHKESDESWVRTDRGWMTVWNHLSRAVLTDDEYEGIEEDFKFQWRGPLRREVREELGEEMFDAVVRGAIRRLELREIARAVEVRGHRCGHRYRIVRVPWMGFDSDALERMQRMARGDRFEDCPRLTEEEATRIRRHSRDLQSDIAFQRAMPHLLALFLRQKTVMAAAFQHRAGLEDGAVCQDCEEWTALEAAEIGGYLTGISQGPYPHLGLFKLCFDHRYGSPQSYRGWLMMLRDEGFRCRGTMPEDLFESLQAIEKERFSPIGSIDFEGEPPNTAPISRRD